MGWAGHNLITPHGDQEPPLTGPFGLFALASHYPSWGSGTLDVPDVMREVYISLPLMGIRNEKLVYVVDDVLNLITPHGDQEPLIL